MSVTLQEAEAQRAALVERYIEKGAKKYGEFASAADGVNHIAFLTDKLEETVEYYTQVIRLRLLRVRTGSNDPRITQVFFDMGRNELLAFLRVPDVDRPNEMGLGGFHHYALTLNKQQFSAAKRRLDQRKVPYTTITHEILTTITTTDPNGIILELSKWNIDPKKVRMSGRKQTGRRRAKS